MRRTPVQPVLTFAIGAIVLSYAVFVLMLLGAAQPRNLAVLGGVVISLNLLLQRLRPSPARVAAENYAFRRLPIAIVILSFGVYYFVNAAAPEIQADANMYHLEAARDALRSGGFDSPISFYERIPHAIELLFAFAFPFGGSPAAKLVHFTFLLASLPLIANIGRRLQIPSPLPEIAAAMYFCTPVVGVSGTSAFNDAAVVFYILAALVFAMKGHPLLAGLAAGFCYAVKVPGAVVVPFAMGILWAQGLQSRRLVFFVLGVALTSSPWMVRNLLDTGNPFAPFFNSWFPNRYFQIESEHLLGRALRSYNVHWSRLPFEVTAGHRLQGILGPLFLLSPVGLLAMTSRSGRLVIALAAFLSLPWWFNAGSRFLMPAVPFIALAMLLGIPKRLSYGLLGIHAITCWTAIVPYYAPWAWRLERFPWRAAIGIQPHDEYLRNASWDYRVARTVEKNTGSDDGILDLHGIHIAHTSRRVMGSWQSPQGQRVLAAFELARRPEINPLFVMRGEFSEQPVRGVRIEQQANTDRSWSIQEIELIRGESRIPNGRDWWVEGSASLADAGFAFDRNFTSRWSTYGPAKRGAFLQVTFEKPELLTGVRAFGLNYENQWETAIWVQAADGKWARVPTTAQSAASINLRRMAMRFARRSGVTVVVAAISEEGIGSLSRSLVENHDDWGLDIVANEDSVYVLRIR